MVPLYRLCFGSLFAFSAAAAVSTNETAVLHLISYIDTHAAQRGADLAPACEKTQAELETILGEVFSDDAKHQWKGRLRKTVLRDDEADPAHLMEVISKLRPAPTDTLFFTYCGHGETRGKDTHVFATGKGDIRRMEVRTGLLAKGARLVVMVSDTCSSPSTADPRIPPRRVPAVWKGFEQLFFDSEGLVDFSAASPGEFAWFNAEGGFFSRALNRLFCEPITELDYTKDGVVTWKELFRRAKQDTKVAFDQAKQAASPESEIQQSLSQSPSWWYLADKPRFARPVLVQNLRNEKVRLTYVYRLSKNAQPERGSADIEAGATFELQQKGTVVHVEWMDWQAVGQQSGRTWQADPAAGLGDPYLWREDQPSLNFHTIKIE